MRLVGARVTRDDVETRDRHEPANDENLGKGGHLTPHEADALLFPPKRKCVEESSDSLLVVRGYERSERPDSPPSGGDRKTAQVATTAIAASTAAAMTKGLDACSANIGNETSSAAVTITR